MKIESQVITVDQAKRLKELGVVQESEFYYSANYGLAHLSSVADWGQQQTVKDYVSEHLTHEAHEIYSAFNVAELGVMIGQYAHRVTLENSGTYLILERGLRDAWFLASPTEAQARASLLIFLIEKNLITPEEVNQRLTANS